MTIEKNLIIKERKRVWALLLEVKRYGKAPYTDELATFTKRPMALCAMASSVNSFKSWLMVDNMVLHTSAEGLEALKSVGVFDETCIAA
jgi:hypothetical protein